MSTKIYVMTHRNFTPPPDPLYVPLFVGHAGKTADFGFLCDDTGDQISDKNPYFSELTGHYWAWKNDVTSEIVGTCHYRRYLINDNEQLLSAAEIENALSSADLLTTKLLTLNFPYEDGFSFHHKPLYLSETGRVLHELFPADHAHFVRLIRENHTYFGNMLIMKKSAYDAYMDWLFSILFTLDKRITIDEPDSYHRRIYGFLSEFLLYVYAVSRGLSVREYKVGMTEEKTEIREVRAKLRQYFAAGDYASARAYFLDCKKKRPDIMMEASDITGELHLSMQAIATAALEDKAYGTHLLLRITDFDALMRYLNALNHFTIARLHGTPDPAEEAWRKENAVTEIAAEVSERMFRDAAAPRFKVEHFSDENFTK